MVVKSIRAAAYYRKSTDQQADSIDRQRAGVEAYARSKGYELLPEAYIDLGLAGDLFEKRPAFQRLLRDAAAGKFDVILVDEPSRLSRQSPIDLIEKVVAPLRRAGVNIDTVSKGPLDWQSLAGLIMLTVHSHKSEEESRDLSRRVLGGIKKKVDANNWYGWIRPYGLRVVREIDPETGKVLSRACVLGPDEEVEAIRFIFDAVANRGWSLRRVCRDLDRRGIKPPNGTRRQDKSDARKWYVGTVRKILLNPKYVGDFTWNATHIGKYSALRDGQAVSLTGPPGNGTRPIKNAPADVIVQPDQLPAIIDRDLFARAGAALARGKFRTRAAEENNRYLFTHLLTCGDCGAFLRGCPHPHTRRKMYLCSKYKEYGSKACSRNCVQEAPLWEAILGALKDKVLSPARLDEIGREMERQLLAQRDRGDVKRLKKQVAALDRDIAQGNVNLARLPEDRLAGVVAQLRTWEGERDRLLAQLGEVESGGVESKAVLAEARRQLRRLVESLQEGDVELQATVVREVVEGIEVRFDHIQTHGRKSPTGRKRHLSPPSDALVSIRPGLGLSQLVISGSPRRVLVGASGRASSFPPACRSPG
jgi:DNA invertase Pin-like site-specific DNA recombinase